MCVGHNKYVKPNNPNVSGWDANIAPWLYVFFLVFVLFLVRVGPVPLVEVFSEFLAIVLRKGGPACVVQVCSGQLPFLCSVPHQCAC